MNREKNKSFHSDLIGTNRSHNFVVLIPERLYFVSYSTDCCPLDTGKYHFFRNDDYVRDNVTRRGRGGDKKYVYEPLNLGCLVDFIRDVNDKLNSVQYQNKAIVHYACTYDFRKYDDAALLIGTYAVAILNMCPKTVYAKLKNKNQRVNENSVYGYGKTSIDLYDCLSAVAMAVKHGFVNFDDFSCRRYYLSSDFTWIVPDKFVAFRGPVEGYCGRHNSLQFYVEYFKRTNVKTVVRLNRAEYNSSWFTDSGIEQVELYFKDVTAPSNAVLQAFLYIAEISPHAIGVHCRMGLGRTGTLIAAYLMEHYKATARQAVAWLRICRPGSVMGPQQPFLMDNQTMLWKTGDRLRKEIYGSKYAQASVCIHGMYRKTVIDSKNLPSNRCVQQMKRSGSRYTNNTSFDRQTKYAVKKCSDEYH